MQSTRNNEGPRKVSFNLFKISFPCQALSQLKSTSISLWKNRKEKACEMFNEAYTR